MGPPAPAALHVPESPDDAAALAAEARRQEQSGNSIEAAAGYERALSAFGPASEHPAAATACVRLGILRAAQERTAEAEQLLMRGLSVLVRQQGAAERALALEAFAALVEIYVVASNRPAVEALGRRYPDLLALYADAAAQ